MNRNNQLYLCSAAVLVLTASSAGFALAQEPPDEDSAEARAIAEPAPPPAVEDVMVVTGRFIRDSEAAALAAKYDSNNVVEVISSDTIGRFPDQNLADSLARLPGLAVERDQGQARFINFRGAPSRWTSIAFDGIDVLGADNGRTPRFDSFPTAITSTVEAHKAVTPAMPGEAVAGFINIKTFSPMDNPGLNISAEGALGRQELGNGDVDRLSGRVSWANETFGIVAFGSNNNREQITDNREPDMVLDESGRRIPVVLDARSYTVRRSDTAYGATLEWEPAAETRFFYRHLYSEFKDGEDTNHFFLDIAADPDDPRFGLSGEVITPEVGFQPLVGIRRALRNGDYKNYTRLNTLGAELTFGDWLVESAVSFSEIGNSTLLTFPFSPGGVAAVEYDLSRRDDPVARLFEAGTRNPIDIGDIAFPLTLGLVLVDELDTEAWKFQFAASRDLDWGARGTAVEFGLQLDTREAKGGDTFVFGGFPASIDVNDFLLDVPWQSAGGLTPFSSGRIYDNQAIRRAWEEAAGPIGADFDDDTLIGIDEDIVAFYGMATTEFDWGSVVYGVRTEYTDFTSRGEALDIAFSNDYWDVLPSIHLNYLLSDAVKLRGSFSTGVSRPNYSELRASAIVNPVDRVVVGGNPTLEAETSWGLDTALEWYFGDASLFAVGAFYRDIDDVIYRDTTLVDGGIYLEEAAGELWELNGFANGSDGRLRGLEANLIAQTSAFMPRAFDGLGVSANVTLLDSEFKTIDDIKLNIPGTSDLIYNAAVFYENFGFSGRLSFQWRDEWVTSTFGDGLTERFDSQKRLNLGLRYTLPFAFGQETLTLFSDINNLTDERDVRFAGSRETPIEIEGFGRRWLVGLRFDY